MASGNDGGGGVGARLSPMDGRRHAFDRLAPVTAATLAGWALVDEDGLTVPGVEPAP